MPATIARQLEQDRLHHRARQIERAMAALKDRAVYRHAVTGKTPAALQHAIADFSSELKAIRRRLRDVA
jgi:hypothetical protein